jgi:hypothetical protein
VVVAVVLLALLAVPMSGIALSHDGDSVLLSGPAGATKVSLDEPGRYEVVGSHGAVVFEVSDEGVRAVAAECPDGVCVRSGYARPGRPIVCAPNGVAATLSSGMNGDVDAVSR